MPPCEVCGVEVTRRKRNLATNKLTCNQCGFYIRNPISAIRELKRNEETIKKYRSNYKIKTANIEYRFNSPFSAIPPDNILQNAIYGLDIDGYYHEFSKVLADYYGIEHPRYYRSAEKVPENAIACYYRSSNEVYSKNGINQKTAFHEMWHALENFGIVPYDPKTSERDADRYATGCVTRLETKKRTD